MTNGIIEKEEFQVEEEKPVSEQPKAPTREDLRAQGWSAEELESAEKRGMLEKKEEGDASKPKPEASKAPEGQGTEKAKSEGQEPAKKPEPKSSIPDFTFQTPEQEKAFLDAFGAGTPQRAMYFRMKNERQARQAATKERDDARRELEEIKARIAAVEQGKPVQEVDEDGNPIDPEDKPLTMKQLRAMQKAEAEAIEKRNQERTELTSRVKEAQKTQEDYARSVFPDFDETVGKAKEVMQNLETLITEPWKQAKAVKLIRELQIAAAHADKIDLDEYHAALIAYEIGKLHPGTDNNAEPDNHGDASEQDGKSKDPKKANGGQLTPEQMKRIEENTQRRASSASISGGSGKRVVSADDVDAKTLNQMSYADRQRFREKYPEKYTQLLRG